MTSHTEVNTFSSLPNFMAPGDVVLIEDEVVFVDSWPTADSLTPKSSVSVLTSYGWFDIPAGQLVPVIKWGPSPFYREVG